jgi:hypothetical protein
MAQYVQFEAEKPTLARLAPVGAVFAQQTNAAMAQG